MFEGKRLRAENARLVQELKALKETSAYQLAIVLAAEIKGIVENNEIPVNQIASAQEQAYAELRKKALLAQAEVIGAQRAKEAVATEHAKIRQEAGDIAAQIAAAAVQKFLHEEAPEYRHALLARYTRTAGAAAIIGAKREIEAEVAAEVGADSLRAPETDMNDREALKRRAQEIRAFTKNSHLLPYSMLNRGDIITLCFVRQGKGHEQLTSPDGYGSSSYNSYHEKRKISYRLIDPEHSLFMVANDSWFKDSKNRGQSIRSGKEVILMADHPETSILSSLVVKAAPVHMEALEGNPITNTDLEVWWVNLGDFRLLS